MRTYLRLLIVGIPLGIFVCLLTQLVVANEMVVQSNKLHLINKRIAELEEQNAYMKQQIVTLSSIQRVSEQADSLGYIDTTNVVAFTADSFPVALNR